MRQRLLYIWLVIAFVFVALLTPSAQAYSYTECFSNVPPSILNWGCPTPSWYSVTSDWQAPRTVGTNPHQGIDIAAPYNTTLKAVWAGWVTQVGSYSIRQRIDINNDGIQNDADYYCNYYHLSNRQPNGYYSKGSTIGKTGNEGGQYESHLHFGGLTTLSTWCRNEICYRWTSNWNGGKDVDVFSNVQWNSGSSCAITICFNDTGYSSTPSDVRVFHRTHGTSIWTDGGTMSFAGNNKYTYSFSGKYPSGTSIDWLVRITRPGLGSSYCYCWAPAKFDQPNPNPNAVANPYAYYQNTLQ